MDASLLLPANGVEGEQRMRMQFLKIGAQDSKYRIWCHRTNCGTSEETFKVVGDGSFKGAWKVWYDAFTKYTGLLWVRRFEPPIPGRWVYKSRGDQGTGLGADLSADADGWTPMSTQPTPPEEESMRPAKRIKIEEDQVTADNPIEKPAVPARTRRVLPWNMETNPTEIKVEGQARQRANRIKSEKEALLDVGVFEEFGCEVSLFPRIEIHEYDADKNRDGCKVIVRDSGASFDAYFRLSDPAAGVDKFCRLQAIRTGNDEHYVWMRKGDMGTQGSWQAFGNGEHWDIYQWFYKNFMQLTSISWRDRMQKRSPPGCWQFVKEGIPESVSAKVPPPRVQLKSRIEVDLTQEEPEVTVKREAEDG